MRSGLIIAGLFDEVGGVAVVNRYRAMAKSLDNGGLTPVFISNLHPAGAGDPAQYCPLPEFGGGAIGRRLQSRFFELCLHRALKRHDPRQISAIIIPRNLVTFRLLLLSRLLWHLPIVVDCMEWHEHWQYKYGWLSPSYWRFLWIFNLVVPRAHGVLAISNYLANHFRSNDMPVFRLLPQIDVDEFPKHRLRCEDTVLKLFYAGTPHKKDNLGLVLRALSVLKPQERAGILFTVAGVAMDDLKLLAHQSGVVWSSIEPRLRVIGRVKRDEVLIELADSDFLILLRPVSRYSNAGFPSKVSESLAAGTPVITNITGDLGDFLINEYNSQIVDCIDEACVALSLLKVLSLDRSHLHRMSVSARMTAEQNFDYRVHNQEFVNFINFFQCNNFVKGETFG